MAGFKLDRMVRLMRAAKIDDGLQERRGVPVEVGKAWAALVQASASEIDAQGQTAGVVAATLTVRAHGIGVQIGTADLVECDGVMWQVTGVMPVHDRRIRSFRVVSRSAA